MDSWLFKTDSLGNLIEITWVTSVTIGQSVMHTKDKGYIVTGTTDIQRKLILDMMFGNKIWSSNSGSLNKDYGRVERLDGK